jgi:O-methyltransferase
MTTFQFISLLLLLIAAFIGFKLLETNWSFKISKPYLWEEAVKNGEVSTALKKIERTYRDKVRFYSIWFYIQQLKKKNVAGAFAELGVYKGETAFFIHQMDIYRKLLLFDTFKGFNATDLENEKGKDAKFNTSNFSDTSLAAVKTLFEATNNVEFFAGYFPESSVNVKEEQFAFVHIDADLYLPTKAALEYFYPKLSDGGIILIHDVNHTWEGVAKAVAEFELSIHESFLPIADWQGSAVLVKNKRPN